MLIEHRIHDVDEAFVTGEEAVPAGEQITLQPPLTHMCSLKTSNTRPSRDKSSSVAKTGSIHSFWVTSYKASRRLDAVSSGPKTRKFRDSRFSSITSRKKVPNTLVDSAFSVPGF